MKKLFTLFFALVASVGTMFASVTIDGIAYNLNETELTAEVTWKLPDYSGEVVIPESISSADKTYTVTSIRSGAFFYCYGLTSVTIPNSVTSIGMEAFQNCIGLTSVTIPNSVTSIGENAFWGCSGFTSVTIPNSVTSIGSGAFSDCTGLTSIIVASDNSNYCSVDGVLFNKDKTTLIQYPGGKQGAYTIPNSVTSIGDVAFDGCSGLTSVTIGNSVTSIGNYAFDGCSGLISVTIPNSVTSIGNGAFSGCTGLTSINVASDNSNYCSVDGVLFNKDKTTLIQYPGGKQGAYTIPNSVTSIGISAFYNCTGLTSVTIPNSVTSIGYYAFSGCSGLTSVTNYATTPQTINSDVFGGNEFDPGVNKSTCVLNVPNESVSLYQAAKGWKGFTNIVGVDVPGEDPVETIPGNYSIYYVDKENQELSDEVVTLHVPVAPIIEGFTFVRWQAYADDIKDGITIQAVYQAEEPSSAPAVYTNPANPAQKLIKNGNVYILTDDKTYTLTGQEVK